VSSALVFSKRSCKAVEKQRESSCLSRESHSRRRYHHPIDGGDYRSLMAQTQFLTRATWEFGEIDMAEPWTAFPQEGSSYHRRWRRSPRGWWARASPSSLLKVSLSLSLSVFVSVCCLSLCLALSLSLSLARASLSLSISQSLSHCLSVSRARSLNERANWRPHHHRLCSRYASTC